jgi:CRISPR-associated endonuclease/helicase Cas3/CRISPR-associated endonuclease Cas3-HD
MPLERHLLGVAARARSVTPPETRTADGSSLREAAGILGAVHDFGKATAWFQTHIGNGTDDEGPSHHARLGGLLAYYALRQRGFGKRTRFAGLVAVAKHHGSLPNHDRFAENTIEQSTTWNDNLYNGEAAHQAAHLEERRPAFARAVLDHVVGDAGSWSDFVTRLTASSDDVRTVGSPPDATLREWIQHDFFRGSRRLRTDRTLFDDGKTYIDELRLFGTLTFADKTHAAVVRETDDRLEADPLAPSTVRQYIDGLDENGGAGDLETRLNAVRSAIQARIDGESEREDPVTAFLGSDSDVATLTLPTGYGKTLTGLLTAARIREATGGDRIVYALPFTSVIDQTADVCREVLKKEAAERDPAMDRRLTVHHHLSESLTLPKDPDQADEETADEDAGRAVLLAESWRAGVTLTTFVQLFESLAGPRNTQSMKLPALYDSVVVIDEPQAIPLTWWPLVDRLIESLVDGYDAKVVLMTATQPRIVDRSGTFELLDMAELERIETDRLGDPPERVEYEFHPTALRTGDAESDCLDYDSAAETLVSTVTGGSDSTLAICNTIDSTGELFDAVLSEFGMEVESERSTTSEDGLVDVAARFRAEIIDDDRSGVPLSDDEFEQVRARFVRSLVGAADPERPAVLYLSTRLRPCDRRFLLGVVSELTSTDIPLLVVSTQLVEAGVDVSFDHVFRDFAPLDSIVQAAGRCNRSFEREPDTGKVRVWRLAPTAERGAVPGEAVYARRRDDTDLDLLSKTRTALAEVPIDETIPGSRIARASVTTYHDAVGDAVATVSADNELRGDFESANGEKLRKESLIETRYTFEVYVCRSDEERDSIRRLREAERSYSFDRIRPIKKSLADIRVSVPVYEPGSDIERRLRDLEPLSMEAEKRDATERVLSPSHQGHQFFDERKGVEVPESNVAGRFL